ncbi:1678_t:CDS:1, partial [Acaulospora morrowiae]
HVEKILRTSMFRMEYCGFLSECEERQFNEFDENISYYLSCLETISKEEGLRSKKAKALLDRYKKASTGFWGGKWVAKDSLRFFVTGGIEAQ